jgi:hypothetical protein
MRGIKSKCCRCGITGEVFGCPSYWYDECSDSQACADRVARQRQKLQDENTALKAQLEAVKQCSD